MTRKIRKFRISAFCLGLLFLLTTALGLWALTPRNARAAEPADSAGHLKFRQVVAGEDFAVALAYDNQLFAWSLLDKSVTQEGENGQPVYPNGNNVTGFNSAGDTLGKYYPSTPIRIDMTGKFTGVRYATATGLAQESGIACPRPIPEGSSYIGYVDDTESGRDYPVMLAATRTTAAFVTRKGLVYVWGKNGVEPVRSTGLSEQATGLLLGISTDNDCHTTPMMIDYVDAAPDILPVGPTGGKPQLVNSISGSEYNYVLAYTVSGSNTGNFMWGQSIYGQQPRNVSYTFGKTDAETQVVVYNNSAVITERAYLGDGNIFYISNNSLYVSGKNFVVPKTTSSADGAIEGIVGNIYVSSGGYDGKTLPAGVDTIDTDTEYVNIANAVTSGYFQTALTSGVTLYDNRGNMETSAVYYNSEAQFYNARGGRVYANVDRSVFSAGNGYAYWLDASGKLCALGDNRHAKIGGGADRLTGGQVSGVINQDTSYVQVVAGKVLAGKPIVEGYAHSTLGWVQDKWNENGTLKDAYVDSETMLSGLLTASGSVRVFGSIEISGGTTRTIAPTLIDDILAKKGLSVAENGGVNKVAALAGGYGNCLFALSDLGKIYKIYYDIATSTFKCDLYDNFTYVASSGSQQTVSDYSNWALNSGNTSVQFHNNAYGTEAQAEIRLAGSTAVGPDNIVSVTPVDVINAEQSYSGDAYRMILPVSQWRTAQTAEQNYLSIHAYDTDGNRDDGILMPAVSTGNPQLNEADGSLASVFDSSRSDNTVDTQYYNNNKANFGKLQFFWSDAPAQTDAYAIPDEVAFRYFDIEYKYTQQVGSLPQISFVITPKQSTMNKTILIKYWVGRCDTAVNFADLERERDASKYTFYDFKQASVAVRINDTMFTAAFTSAKEDSTNSAVPLLDPNNPYNNTYSLAVMNVSAGFEAVLDQLDTLLVGNYAYNRTATNSQLLSNILAADSGFPASAKIKLGSLAYYNASVQEDYRDTYRYLASDHDGDIISITTTDFTSTTNNFRVNVYDGDKKITVFMPFKTGESASQYLTLDLENENDAALLAELKNLFEKTTVNGHVLRFDNRYGLTMSVVSKNMGTAEAPNYAYGIEFKYAVATITATGSMTSGLRYEEVETGVYDISRPITAVSTEGTPSYAFELSLRDEVNNRSITLANGTTARRAIEVFTQASLVFSEQTGSDNTPVAKHTVYGAPTDSAGHTLGGLGTTTEDRTESGKTNTYVYKDITLNLGVSSQKNYQINLGGLFARTENIAICYDSGDGGPVTGEAAWNKLKNSFVSGSDGNALELTDVRNNYFVISPRRAVDNYEFTIEVRRFPLNGNIYSFVYNGQQAETVYIKFNVSVRFSDALFSKQQSPNNPSTITGTDPVDFPLSQRISTTEDILRDFAEMAEISSDNNSIVTAAWSDDKQSIRLTPRSSGTARIYYKLKLYDKVIEDSFPVRVATLSLMPTAVKVVKDELVYFSELMNYINSVNDLNGVVLALNDNNGTELPYHFERTDDTSNKADADKVWYEIESIPFLSKVYLDSSNKKAYMGMTMGAFDSTETAPIVRIVVSFKDQNGTGIYNVAFRVEPAAQSLRDTSAGGDGAGLVIEINKGSGTIAIVNRADDSNAARNEGLVLGDGGSFRIPVEFLVSLMSGTEDDQRFELIAAQAVSSDGYIRYDKYIDVALNDGGSELLITPKYPTQDMSADYCNVQASVRVKNTSSVTLLNFSVRVTGIKTTLEKSQYTTLILAVFFSVLLVLIIIFFIRMGLYWKRRAEQKRIVKKNQTLIKMRDKMHNKTDAVSKERLVHTKLKMEDPKYARMFNSMRAQKEAQTGMSLDNSIVAQKAETREEISKAAKKKKKKGGKRSLEELQAELAAKREAVARMQNGDFSDMPDVMPVMDGAPMDGAPMDQPIVEDVPVFNADPTFEAQPGFDGMASEPMSEPAGSEMGPEGIVIEPFDGGEENQG